MILCEAVKRSLNPVEINYLEAIIMASAGLLVNIASAIVLHHEEHTDHNIRAAYLHVLADALTSISAIAGLTAAWLWDIPFLDAAAAILSSFVIIKWSAGLLKDSGKSLLDIGKFNQT